MNLRPLRAPAACAALTAALALPAAAPAAPRVSVTRDVTYARVGRLALKLDVYRPVVRGPRPAVLGIHGGGWVTGDKAGWAAFGRRIAASGFVAFTIDYRLICADRSNPLCTQKRYPAALRDAQAAARWVRLNGARYGASTGRVGAVGGSAGGYLVDALGVLGRPGAAGHADAVVSWSGPPDLRLHSSGVGLGPGDAARRALVLNFLGCASATDCPVSLAASPVTHVTRRSAPTLQFNSSNELVPLAGPREFARALSRNRVPNRLIVRPGAQHAEQYGDAAMPQTLRWLHRYLDPPRKRR